MSKNLKIPEDIVFVDLEYYRDKSKVIITEFCAIHFHKLKPTRLLYAHYSDQKDVKVKKSPFLEENLQKNQQYGDCHFEEMHGSKFEDDIQKATKFFKNHHVVGFNIGSDMSVLSRFTKAISMKLELRNFYCFERILRSIYDENFTLRVYCEYLKIDQFTSRHSAILDTFLTAECFFELHSRLGEHFPYHEGKIKGEIYEEVKRNVPSAKIILPQKQKKPDLIVSQIIKNLKM